MTYIFAVVVGLSIFIAGQIFVRFILDPIHNLKIIKGEIASTLIFNANRYGLAYQKTNLALDEPNLDKELIDAKIAGINKWNDELNEASDITHALAGKLIECAEAIPFYESASYLKLVPPKSNIIEAKSQLIGLSNSFSGVLQHQSGKRSKKICDLLSIVFSVD